VPGEAARAQRGSAGRTGVGERLSAPFGERLAAAVGAYGTLCVGIDPHPGLLARWGLTDDPDGLERFALVCVEALGGHVAVVKPQSAFFERHGSGGIAVLERVLEAVRGTGTLSLLDVKRGDIGSTMDGYADAYLAVGAPLGADAVTLSPYLGFGSLTSAIRTAGDAGRGVFVLARTSNPEGADVQLAVAGGGAGRSVAQGVVDAASAANRDALATAAAREEALTGVVALGKGCGPEAGLPAPGPPALDLPALGPVGVVVGATTDHGLDLSALSGAVLAPGLGAQGAGPSDLAARFAGVRGVVLPAASRSVLEAGPDPAAVRAAAVALRDELAAAHAPTH
jgi:orotidine-5'-phosphate decarboxylase